MGWMARVLVLEGGRNFSLCQHIETSSEVQSASYLVASDKADHASSPNVEIKNSQ
jgi:hypothetical protein